MGTQGNLGKLVAVVASLAFCATASADVVFSHDPYNYGGLASDTDFLIGSTPVWQRVADDFRLTEPAVIDKVLFWGFYDRDNPPATETMRVRVLGARPGDGLPEETAVVRDESFLNPNRVATGRFVFVGISPDEYRYEVDLSSPLALEAETDYWLEIAQIGDRSTYFRWEYGFFDGSPLAAIGAIIPQWHYSGNEGNNAFQLSTIPEPTALGLLLLAACAFPGRHIRRPRGGAMR